MRIEVEYYDQGTDVFFIQFDALSGGPFGDGSFKETLPVEKTDSRRFRTVAFTLHDAYFANRDNGADLRIADAGDDPYDDPPEGSSLCYFEDENGQGHWVDEDPEGKRYRIMQR